MDIQTVDGAKAWVSEWIADGSTDDAACWIGVALDAVSSLVAVSPSDQALAAQRVLAAALVSLESGRALECAFLFAA